MRFTACALFLGLSLAVAAGQHPVPRDEPIRGTIAVSGRSPSGTVPAPPGFAVRASAAPSDTPWVAPTPPDPVARYGSFQSAREHLEILVRRTLGTLSDSARWTRKNEPFVYRDAVRLNRTNAGSFYWTVEARDSAVIVPCLHVTLESHRDGTPGSAALGKALEAAGWAMDDVYDADGPDGTHFAYVCREALCDIDGRWDGGDDSDSTSVASPGETFELRCVPRTPRPGPTTGREDRPEPNDAGAPH